MGKGASFERKICKELSLWWTKQKRDDVFWRSCQSGGRATERAKKGKTTFGSYGDIAAVDPIGQPLLQLLTIELKRGRSHGCPTDLLDAAPTKAVRPFEATLNQTIGSARAAKSRGWLLICKRDRMVPMAYVDLGVFMTLRTEVWQRTGGEGLTTPPFFRFDIMINQPTGRPQRVRFVGLPLSAFLHHCTPAAVRSVQDLPSE